MFTGRPEVAIVENQAFTLKFRVLSIRFTFERLSRERIALSRFFDNYEPISFQSSVEMAANAGISAASATSPSTQFLHPG